MAEVARKKPVTPGQRFQSKVDYSILTKTKAEKSLLKPVRKTGGRNNHGNITSRFRGGGVKRAYRMIDFYRDKDGVPGIIKSIEYDPNRTSYISLVFYADGEKRYMLTPQKSKVGDKIFTGTGVDPDPGNAMPLKDIPLGTVIHNVELNPGRGAVFARSAGSFVRLTAKEDKYAHITLPSGEVRRVLLDCRATIGQIGNVNHKIVSYGKAGIRRKKGFRPHVRGTAMNPVDHPLGGGEGRTTGGRHPVSPTGVPAKGGKTRKKRNISNDFIIRRRKK